MSDTGTAQGADIPPSDTPHRPVFTVRQATDVCQVSRRTIARHIDALAEHGAYKDENGAWQIPVEALEAVGLRPGRPAAPDKPSHVTDQGRKPASVTGAQAVTVPLDEYSDLLKATGERDGLREQLAQAQRHIEDMRQTAWQWHDYADRLQQQLMPGPAAETVVDVREADQTKRRGLFKR